MNMYTQKDVDEMHIQYRRLVTGEAVSIVIDQNGERIEYSTGDAAKLWASIRMAESQLAAANGKLANRPLTFRF